MQAWAIFISASFCRGPLSRPGTRLSSLASPRWIGHFFACQIIDFLQLITAYHCFVFLVCFAFFSSISLVTPLALCLSVIPLELQHRRVFCLLA